MPYNVKYRIRPLSIIVPQNGQFITYLPSFSCLQINYTSYLISVKAVSLAVSIFSKIVYSNTEVK